MASARTKRAQYKKYYSKNVKELKTKAKAASKASYSAEPEKKMAASRASYSADPSKKKAASKLASKASYSTDPSKKKAASKASYTTDPSKKKAASKASYSTDPSKKKAASKLASKASYSTDPSKKKAASKLASKASYSTDPSKKKAASKLASKASYSTGPSKKKAASKLASKASYSTDPSKKKAASKLASKASYSTDPSKKKAASRARYFNSPQKKKAAARAYSKRSYTKNPTAKSKQSQAYYAHNTESRCAYRRARYVLAEPKRDVQEQHVKELQNRLLLNSEARVQLITAFKKRQEIRMPRVMSKAVCRMAARRLLNKSLQTRKEHVGSLLKACRLIKSLQIEGKEDFGEGCHTASAEPYFYDSCYQIVRRDYALPIDENGKCVVAKEIESKTKTKHRKHPMKWECSSECKPLTEAEVDTIVSFKAAFENPMQEVRHTLDTCDGCPNQHYTKVVEDSSVDLRGHPLVCSNDGGCDSKLRVLRAAGTHYPVLGNFYRNVNSAISSHLHVRDIDMALLSGDFESLMEINKVDDFDALLSNNVESSYEQCTDIVPVDSTLGRPHLESKLLEDNVLLIAQLQKEIDDYPQHACCSCERLHQRKAVSRVELSQNLGGEVWLRLKSYIAKQNPTASEQVLYMCRYCKSLITKNVLPPRCVLNGLHVVPIPQELARLDCLSSQLIQRAKCYQTVVRLGTYTGKVPIYNSLKACKGTMFFLPLPLNKTLATLDEVEQSTSAKSALPNPELYIIVNGKPTKLKVVWRSLVDVNHVKAAIQKLKDTNWLYSKVTNESVDEAAKQVIEVSNNTTSTMLEKASESEIAGFQSFTIRNLENKLPSESDIEQYKVLSVKENPLDNRQRHLDVMCFPVLFPTGEFGEYHPRAKLSHSEYIKSRLLNKDSRFRKDPQYVFYLLWQKEMRELSAGVYNLLKSTRRQHMSVRSLLDRVETSDEHLEANLCTMLQSVRGTKQYWFVRQSELKCMVREWGSPTLFLTFSCAEYESPDIANYLRSVNNVSSSYNIGKLCTEDPISVSRQFSLKFHAFFNTVLKKGEVLGKVDHFYWKKEYQARGAPHYHVLLWIRDAPVIGQDDPDKVLSWIQERITCQIPDKETSPELHRLVTRYQMHKCSAYCKRKRKCSSGAFITRCRFGFPRQECESAKLNSVSDSLRSRKKIYELPRGDTEVRVNDYNPLLLMLWQANIDIQFVAESSLALAHYVSGYVTKAERSNMQEIWQEVSENKSVYSRLWSFGVRSLRFRECGLYEASDLLLGDHLNEKSGTVKWVDVSLPHKRCRRLMDHKVLLEIAEHNPDTEEIFEDNLLDTYYPQRPARLENVCLYDFVANYDWYGKDSSGNRKYSKLTKPRLPNHKLFDPEKETQREDYYYSLILLFVPFRTESSLLLDNETAEEAFRRLVNTDSSSYHARLQKMLEAQSNIKKINEARHAEGEEEKISKEDNDPQLMGEARTAMDDVVDMNVKSSTDLPLESRVAMLNADQRRIFDNVKSHLLHQQQHEEKKCHCSDLKPLRTFVSGVGGTGKSFLIEAIKALIADIWPTNDLTCAVAAPTGLAAFNVGGITIHRLFQLPVEHEGKTAGYWSLPKPSQKLLKSSLSKVKMFIIDEVSMVSSLNLAYMHLRLEELFGGNEWFGSRNMLFVGDLLQLQPVNGTPVFEKITQKSLSFKLGCAASVNIWRDCVLYDELTINERQKNDQEFSSMLDCVRRGCPTDETIRTLQQRVIQVSVSDKFHELQESGQTPVCLLPTRKACSVINNEMLGQLNSEVHELLCTDEVDETSGTLKWNKKAAERLEKLNRDCNMTAGLEAKLSLAVGARVMLRRNIDTKTGLVNGAIGTVHSISVNRVTVQFDHISEPYDVEMVKSRFMVMKNFYVYRKQFPLILAYAVTIHKSQGLSLDCAIIDLSDTVFSAGMAYVALSRVRSLAGVYLVAFDPKSIMVSVTCLKEVNRLRDTYRKDLPLYVLPLELKRGTKRKLTGTTHPDQPKAKKAVLASKKAPPKKVSKPKAKKATLTSKATPHRKDSKPGQPEAKKGILTSKPKKVPKKVKRSGSSDLEDGQPRKKPHTCSGDDDDPDLEAHSGPSLQYKFYPVNEQWQRNKCALLGLQFYGKNSVSSGGPHVALTPPDLREIKHIPLDGNCFFRSICYIITGSEDQHMAVRTATVDHLRELSEFQCNLTEHPNVQQYIQESHMYANGIWASTNEMMAVAHMLRTSIFSYSMANATWHRFTPQEVEEDFNDDGAYMAMYIRHPHNHFDVVRSTLQN